MLPRFKELMEAINDKIDNLDPIIQQIIIDYLNNLPYGTIIENVGVGDVGLVREAVEDTFIFKLANIAAGETAYIANEPYISLTTSNWDVNWGDGTGWITYSNVNAFEGNINHVYNVAGDYIVKIKPHDPTETNWLSNFGTGDLSDSYIRWFAGHLKSVYTPLTDKMRTVNINSHCKIFNGCTNLEYVCDNFLPATTLYQYCYMEMFAGCTSLTKMPKNLLPATTLSNLCYARMFMGSGINELKVGELPATTLANQCYLLMFAECNNLTSLPVGLLPATTLNQQCYQAMFQNSGIIELNEGVFHPGPVNGVEGAYQSMFKNCVNLTTVNGKISNVAYPANRQFQEMFSGCISLNHIDKLFPYITQFPTTDNNFCCSGMFMNCNNLATIPNDLILRAILSNGLKDNTLNSMFKIDTGSAGLIDIGTIDNDWFDEAPTAQSQMFYGQTNITTPITYANIPNGWK